MGETCESTRWGLTVLVRSQLCIWSKRPQLAYSEAHNLRRAKQWVSKVRNAQLQSRLLYEQGLPSFIKRALVLGISRKVPLVEGINRALQSLFVIVSLSIERNIPK